MNLYLYKQVLAICCIFEKLAAHTIKFEVHCPFHIRYILARKIATCKPYHYIEDIITLAANHRQKST